MKSDIKVLQALLCAVDRVVGITLAILIALPFGFVVLLGPSKLAYKLYISMESAASGFGKLFECLRHVDEEAL